MLFCLLLYSLFFCLFFFLSDRSVNPTYPWLIFLAISFAFISFFIVKITNYNWGLVAVVIAGFALLSQWGWNAYQDTQNKERNYQHIKPEIVCLIEYPIKSEEGKVTRNTRNPDIIIANKGSIKAVSLTADIKVYSYDEEKKVITNYIDNGFKSFEHAMSSQELLPYNEIRQSCIGLDSKNWIAVYCINVSYHRESDMKQYIDEYYFFTKQKKIIDPESLKNNGLYDEIISKVKEFDPDKIDGALKITAADEHTWYVENDGTFAVKINEEGKLIFNKPKLQIDPLEGYPYLKIRPTKFKGTDVYIKPTLHDEYIQVLIPFTAKNTGVSTAYITKDGFETIATIEPNMVLYTEKEIQVRIKDEDAMTLNDYLNKIDTEERLFKYRFFVYYRPTNNPEELYKVVVHYNIGKDGFNKVSDQDEK
jgi:hypothetical protein